MIDCQSEGIPAPTHQWKKQQSKHQVTDPSLSSSSNLDGIGMVPDESDTNDQQQQQGSVVELDTNSGNYILLHNDLVAIVSGPHIHVLENGSLAIIDANKSDEGEFVCEALVVTLYLQQTLLNNLLRLVYPNTIFNVFHDI